MIYRIGPEFFVQLERFVVVLRYTEDPTGKMTEFSHRGRGKTAFRSVRFIYRLLLPSCICFSLTILLYTWYQVQYLFLSSLVSLGRSLSPSPLFST